MAELSRRYVAWLLDFVDLPAGVFAPVTSFWSGTGELTYNSRTYRGTNGIISLSDYSVELGEPNNRLTATLQLSTPEVARQFLIDNGPYNVEVDWIYSEDNGATWNRLGRKIIGKLSNPLIKNQTYQIEVETIHGDIDRGEVLYWSDEDQKRVYVDDRGLEYMRKLSEGIDIKWPP